MRRFIVSFISCLAIASVSAGTASGSAGNLLRTGGFPAQVLVQPDGRILLAATAGPDSVVLRLRPNGRTDPSFGGGAIEVGAGTRGQLGIALQGPDKVLSLTGEMGSGLLQRFHADGSVDTAFGSGGAVEVPVSTGLTVQPDGRILMGESRTYCDRYLRCSSEGMVIRLLADGSPDTDFGSGGVFRIDEPCIPGTEGTCPSAPSSIVNIDLDSEGNIFVGLSSSGLGRVAKLQSDGSPYPGFGVDGVKTLENGSGRLTVQGTTVTTVSRDSWSNGPLLLARYGTGGSPDPTFGAGGTVNLPQGEFDHHSLVFGAFQPVGPLVSADGSVLLAGSVSLNCRPDYSCEGGIHLTRYDSSGTLDSSWGDDGAITDNLGASGGTTVAADTQTNDRLVVATTADVEPDRRDGRSPSRIMLRRYDRNGQLDPSFGTSGTRSIPDVYPTCLGRAADLLVADGEPVKGGPFTNSVIGSPANDDLAGWRGNESICGRGGNDTLHGKAGNDGISGGNGADDIAGGTGNDRIFGGRGRDRISGGPGRDRVFARDGFRDRIVCGPGRDVATVDRRDRTLGCERVIRPRK